METKWNIEINSRRKSGGSTDAGLKKSRYIRRESKNTTEAKLHIEINNRRKSGGSTDTGIKKL